MSQSVDNLLSRLEVAVERLESLVSGNPKQTSSPAEVVPPSVLKYQEFVNNVAKPFCEETISLDEKLKDVGNLLLDGFQEISQIVSASAKGKKPTTDGMKELLSKVVEILNKIEKLRADSKGTPLWDHFSALNEISKCLQWVGVRDITTKYVKETVVSSQFYTMRVQREFREKDPRHMEWIKHMSAMVNTLAEYINDHHTSGLRFNPKAEIDALQAYKNPSTSNSGVPATPTGVPPPLAPPPLAPPPVPSSINRGPAPDMSGVFDAIKNFKTSGLKRVTDDMKTKNRPKEEKTSVVPSEVQKKTSTLVPSTSVQRGPPRFELVEDKKWEIFYQTKNNDIEIEEDQVKMHHTIYVMKCDDSLIQVRGKVNSIVLDGCVRTSIIFDSAVSSCELVNCQSCKIQVKGKSPMISLNKVDGVQIFLSQESATCPIYSSKSSEMNICITNDEDYDEIPLPELFVSRYDPKTKQVVTIPEEI